MRNTKLSNLNFCQLLNYGGQPIVQNTYNPPLSCSGYCVTCEASNNVFVKNGDHFDQMSHGCDTSDFEVLLGATGTKNPIGPPVMFLLENPGGDYGNGNIVPFVDYSKHPSITYNKQPPVNHYYWTPDVSTWPTNPYSLSNLYGTYFAYIMKKHNLNNVYITNLIKCNTITSKHTKYNKDRAIEICTNRWLKQELAIFQPRCVFCFGRNAEKGFIKIIKNFGLSIKTVYLFHPSAIDLSQRYKKTKAQMIDENDVRISQSQCMY
ncbi:MAG: hypothetical protein HQK62_14760 [Desulfamplus sp.]|nr:hypothetical protein [Desulfamplus sp.]